MPMCSCACMPLNGIFRMTCLLESCRCRTHPLKNSGYRPRLTHQWYKSECTSVLSQWFTLNTRVYTGLKTHHQRASWTDTRIQILLNSKRENNLYIFLHMYEYKYTSYTRTGWRRPIGCLELQMIFRKRATNCRALSRERTSRDKASYGSLPPCSAVQCMRCMSCCCRATATGLLQLYRLPKNVGLFCKRALLKRLYSAVYELLLQSYSHRIAMGWLRSVGSIKLQVSFAEYRLFYRALLQKRPIILRSLLIVATP